MITIECISNGSKFCFSFFGLPNLENLYVPQMPENLAQLGKIKILKQKFGTADTL